MNRSRGFTIIELLITLAVMAVLLTIGAPSFNKMTRDNRMQSETYALRGALAAARSEAQAQRVTVTLCRSTNGASCSNGDWGAGYIAFIDTDQDGVLDDPDEADGEQLVHAHPQGSEGLAIRFSQGADLVRFDNRGNALGSNGTFTFCDERGAPEARGIIVTAVGAIRAAVDDGVGEDSEQVVDDHAGADLSC